MDLIQGSFQLKATVLSSGSSSRVRGRGEPRDMKSMWPPLVAIFFMTYFYRAGGGMAPSAPPDPLLVLTVVLWNQV